MVKFARLNLLDADWPVREPVDAIFCRNVMIYFDKPTQKRILERFAPPAEAAWAAVRRALGKCVACQQCVSLRRPDGVFPGPGRERRNV